MSIRPFRTPEQAAAAERLWDGYAKGDYTLPGLPMFLVTEYPGFAKNLDMLVEREAGNFCFYDLDCASCVSAWLLEGVREHLRYRWLEDANELERFLLLATMSIKGM